MEIDYYQALGVSSEATAAEIKAAYRILVRLNHPDANPDNREASEAAMKQVLRAYATLGDVQKRARYDNDFKLRAYEKSQQDSFSVVHHPARYSHAPDAPSSLMGRVRVTLGESSQSFANKLGLSEADVHAFEARDAMPQAALQMRTFANFVERAAQKLETAQRSSEASDLRSAYERKKANRNFMR
ncbi:DnaJ domain-containing protein [Abditibacterium utsteinense]|uniref:DnaJ domain-containing protein n=1 Tax=Abditibacterium utsteinense TaxID=1960156 RepID=A0A2S8SVN3_9BACT|nr:DnaJ domain-containing protein [Abditibacterium utsteinense]PQV64842.1 DnaJ domain-containing protein [Abditibacterium utsteinense]